MQNSGVMYINKPVGMTSRDVVNIVCKKLKTKKVGHCGTLDPLASGVLLICVGEATKLVQYLTSSFKEYEVTMQLGVRTETGDLEGEIVESNIVSFTDEEILSCFDNFEKKYSQVVPKYSAVKINGKKLYEYAREGIEIELPSRIVEVNDLQVTNISREKDVTFVSFTCSVSKGTYIRSLCEDLAKTMGTYSVMTELIRSKQGNVTIDECYDLDECKLVSIHDVDLPINIHMLTNLEFEDVKFGRRIYNKNDYQGFVALYFEKKLVAIYEASGEELKSKRGINCD